MGGLRAAHWRPLRVLTGLRGDAVSTDLRRDGAAALEWAVRYLERVDRLPVMAKLHPGEIRARLPPRAPEDPEPFSAVLEDLEQVLLPGITHWQHPRYFAYFAISAS